MQKLGAEVFETNYDDFSLQTAWAIENECGELLQKPNALQHIFLKQVERFQPDVLFIYAGAFHWMPFAMREAARERTRNKLTITGLWGDELPSNATYAEFFKGMDIIFVTTPLYVDHFAGTGLEAVMVGNCFDEGVPYRKNLPKLYDLTFAGTSGYGYPDHVGRYEKLTQAMRETDLQIWTSEPSSAKLRADWLKAFVLQTLIYLPHGLILPVLKHLHPRGAFIANAAAFLRQNKLSAFAFMPRNSHPMGRYFDGKPTLKQAFPDRVHPNLMGSKYYELLSQSRMVLNVHRDEAADIANIRCFEATGVGSCLVTDHGEGMKAFFDIENDIVTFDSVEELKEKTRYLLDHPHELARIAANGQKATLARHTAAHRCAAVIERLRSL